MRKESYHDVVPVDISLGGPGSWGVDFLGWARIVLTPTLLDQVLNSHV